MTEHEVLKLQEKVKLYENALIEIVCVLEPVGWVCPEHKCAGCQYEHDDACLTAMKVLAGLDPHENLLRLGTPAEKRREIQKRHKNAMIHRGFKYEDGMWKRGTAF